MGTRLSNMRTTNLKLTGRGLTDGTAQPQKIKYSISCQQTDLSLSTVWVFPDSLWRCWLIQTSVLLSRLFQLLITRSEKKWCLKLDLKTSIKSARALRSSRVHSFRHSSLRRYGNFLSSGNILVNLCWILSIIPCLSHNEVTMLVYNISNEVLE